MQKQVTIKNEEGVESKVAPSAVKHFEKVGWTVVDDGSSESEQAGTEKTKEG